MARLSDLPVDDTLVLPQAVRQAAARAEGLHSQASAMPDTPALVTDPPQPAAPAAVIPQTYIQAPPIATVEIPYQPTLGLLEPPGDNQPQAPQPDIQQELTRLRNELSTAQGRHRADVDRLTAELRTANNTNASLNSLMQAMQQAPQPPRQAPPVTTVVAPSAEDVEAYGADLISKAQQWARASLDPELQALRQQLSQIQGQVQTTTTQTLTGRVDQALDTEIGRNWREIDHSAEFHAWLRQPDIFSGQPRGQLLQTAYTSGNATSSVALFKAYLAEQASASGGLPPPLPPPAPLTPPSGGPGPSGAAPVDLASLAAPGRGQGAPAPQAPNTRQARTYTDEQVTRFYNDKRMGRYKPADADAIERDIHLAAGQGRIVSTKPH